MFFQLSRRVDDLHARIPGTFVWRICLRTSFESIPWTSFANRIALRIVIVADLDPSDNSVSRLETDQWRVSNLDDHAAADV